MPQNISIFQVHPKDYPWGSPYEYVQDGSAPNFVQDVHVQFQPCTSAQTNPTPDITLAPTSTLVEGSRSARAVTRLRRVFWWRFSLNSLGRSKGQPRPASTKKTSILHKVLCRPVLHIGRVLPLLASVRIFSKDNTK